MSSTRTDSPTPPVGKRWGDLYVFEDGHVEFCWHEEQEDDWNQCYLYRNQPCRSVAYHTPMAGWTWAAHYLSGLNGTPQYPEDRLIAAACGISVTDGITWNGSPV